MAQETYYFSHDYNPLSDPKLQAMVSVYGATGYGIFWRAVELLHANEKHTLPLETYIYMAIGREMCVPIETVREIIEASIGTFKLFDSDDDYFWSNRVFKNITKREESILQRSNAGKASAAERKRLKELADKLANINSTVVERSLTGVERSSTKERKEKEKK